MLRRSLCLFATMLAGCSAPPSAPVVAPEPPRASAPSVEVAAAEVETRAAPERAEKAKSAPTISRPRELPTACAGDGDICTPPRAFSQWLCKSTRPNLALTMFRASSPWTRAYVRQDMEAWYASARRSRPRQLRYAEEVIIVGNRAQRSPGAVQISGMGSYDVLRWDGSCVSLMEGELSFIRPSTPDVATIDWRRLEHPITDAFEMNPKIAYRNQKRRKDCKGFGEQAVTRCERAELGLSRMIAEYVRGGGEFPAPHLP